MTKAFLALVGAALPVVAAGQAPEASCRYRGSRAELARRASPLDSVEVTIDGRTVRVCYGRPSAHGRSIMGGLVPFGSPWRLGANEPTRLILPFAADVAGVDVAAGTYSLYVVPQRASWELHINKAVDRWGIPIDDAVQAQDVGKARIPVETLAQPVEQLTMHLNAGPPTQLVVEWEKTRVRIPLKKRG